MGYGSSFVVGQARAIEIQEQAELRARALELDRQLAITITMRDQLRPQRDRFGVIAAVCPVCGLPLDSTAHKEHCKG